jgi:ATP-dependent Lon protease
MPDKNVSSSHSPEEAGTYPVLPLRDIVVFPHMIVPLFVGREKSIRALEEVMGSDKQIMLATQINASDDDPEPSGIYDIGTIANVLQLLKLPDGTVKVLVEGRARAEIVEYTDREEYYEARAVELAEPEETRSRSRPCRARWFRSLKTTSSSTRRSRLKSSAPPARSMTIRSSPTRSLRICRSRFLKSRTCFPPFRSRRRLEKSLGFMEGEISVLQVEKRIRSRVKRQMEKTQREYYLNEQMKAIQKELGDGEDGRDEMAELEEPDLQDQADQGSPREGRRRIQEAQADEPDVGGSHRRAQLS